MPSECGANLIRARALVAVQQSHSGVVGRHRAGAEQVGELPGAAGAGKAQSLPLTGVCALLGVVEFDSVVLVPVGCAEVVGAARLGEGPAQCETAATRLTLIRRQWDIVLGHEGKGAPECRWSGIVSIARPEEQSQQRQQHNGTFHIAGAPRPMSEAPFMTYLHGPG